MVGFIFFSLVFGVTVAVGTIVAAVVEAAFGKRPAFGPDEAEDYAPPFVTGASLPPANCHDHTALCSPTGTACTTSRGAGCRSEDLVEFLVNQNG